MIEQESDKFGEYFDIIRDKFERGLIDLRRFIFLVVKLAEWEYVYNELEDE